MRIPAGMIAAFGAVLITACAHTGVAKADRQRPLLEQRQHDLFAAVEARNADTLAGYFADDAVVHIANMPPIAGREAIRRLYDNMFRFMASSTAQPEMLRVSESGDLAYGTGSTANEFRGPDGPVRYDGKYVLVWRMVGGEWMVAHYGISANQPTEPR